LKLLAARRQHWERQGKRGSYKDPATYSLPGDLPDLPASWKYLPVEHLSTKVVDGVHKKPTYEDSGVPFVTVRNLTFGPGIDFSQIRYISPADHEEFSQRADPVFGDILITKDGTLGVVRAIRTETVFSIFVSVALVKPINYDLTDYLELAFQSPVVQQQMVGVGTGLQHIHLTDLKKDLIPVAPPTEQSVIIERVRHAFSVIDAVARDVDRARELLDRLDQATLAKAFRGELFEKAS
jgi:type I restriction enzyme S subunit